MFSHDDFEILEEDLHSSFNINKNHRSLPPTNPSRHGREESHHNSSGMSDIDLTNSTELALAPAYAISKAGVNVAVAKYSALYKNKGILFMSVCPGNVATERQTRGKPTHQ
jgi:NAD(P)-dependent dehydrogenase (short-subunit alcohol dehydrogenase family)